MVEEQIRRGHPDLNGLCLALADWSAELRILLGTTKGAAGRQSGGGKLMGPRSIRFDFSNGGILAPIAPRPNQIPIRTQAAGRNDLRLAQDLIEYVRLSPTFSLVMTSPWFFVSEPPALSMARVVCFCQPMAVIISSSVVPPSRLSIAIT